MAEDRYIPSSTELLDLGSNQFRLITSYAPDADLPDFAWLFDEATAFFADDTNDILTHES